MGGGKFLRNQTLAYYRSLFTQTRISLNLGVLEAHPTNLKRSSFDVQPDAALSTDVHDAWLTIRRFVRVVCEANLPVCMPVG